MLLFKLKIVYHKDIISNETYTSFVDIMHLRYQFIHFFSDLVIFI